MVETTQRKYRKAGDIPLLPCLLTLPPPGVCLILSLEPQRACTLLKSNFWSRIWTWKNKKGFGGIIRTVCETREKAKREWKTVKIHRIIVTHKVAFKSNKMCNIDRYICRYNVQARLYKGSTNRQFRKNLSVKALSSSQSYSHFIYITDTVTKIKHLFCAGKKTVHEDESKEKQTKAQVQNFSEEGRFLFFHI